MKHYIAVLVFTIIGLFSATPVLAQTFSTGDTPTLQRGQTINGDYFATGERVTISGTVNGDAYVAGGAVLVDGVINGDLLVAGGNVTIRGRITQDVRAAGGNISISSQIGGNTTITGGSVLITDSATLSGSLVAGVGNLEVFAPIGKGATIGGGTVQIGNEVGGNIMAGVGELTILPDAQVQGDITYWSDREATVSPEASISGQITQHAPPQGSTQAAEGFFSAVSLVFTLMSFLSSLVLGLLLIKFVPRFFDKAARSILDTPGRSALAGFIIFALTPFFAFVLLITIFLIPLSILIMVFYFIALYISKLFISYAIGMKAAEVMKATWARGLLFAVGLVIYYILTMIPVLGWLLSFVGMILGLGALFYTKKDYYRVIADRKKV